MRIIGAGTLIVMASHEPGDESGIRQIAWVVSPAADRCLSSIYYKYLFGTDMWDT